MKLILILFWMELATLMSITAVSGLCQKTAPSTLTFLNQSGYQWLLYAPLLYSEKGDCLFSKPVNQSADFILTGLASQPLRNNLQDKETEYNATDQQNLKFRNTFTDITETGLASPKTTTCKNELNQGDSNF